MNEDKLLRVSEVAKMTNLSNQTIRNYEAKGFIKGYRHPINNFRVYYLADVEKLVALLKEVK